MEYIPGITLSEKLPAGPLTEKEVLRLGIQLAEGLAAAHEHGVVHRDLKPGNLRLTGNERLKILDFGLAKLQKAVTESVATESTLESRAITGTLAYMAPEQLYGDEIDARADIHAAGLVLYEMATGQRPFAEVESSQLIGAILRRSPIPPTTLNPGLSPELARIIGKCLEKEPENRYQSAKELAIDLRRLQTGELITVQPAAKPAKWSFAKSVGLGMGILAAVSAVLIAFNIGNVRQRLLNRGDAPRIESLAVLPLENLSGDKEQDYFADGMTEELITNLAKISALKVISRTSVMQYKGTKKPLPQIAKELNVDAIMEGSVLREGGQVRITAQLIQASTDRHLWAESYQRDLRGVLALQGEIASVIAEKVQATLTPTERARLASARPVNPEAYEAYLKGRFYWYQVSKSGFEQAERYFLLALQKDPNYALAYSGLADVWLMRTDTGYLTPSETLPKAKSFALKALELDPTLAEPHVSLGNIAFGYEHDWAAAEGHFQRAIQVNPSSAIAHFMYADQLISLKRNQEWEVEIHRSISLDPMNYFQLAFYGWHLIYLGRYDEAIENLNNVLTTNPNFPSAHMGLWGAYFKKHMDKEAFAEAVRFFEVLEDHEAVEALNAGFAATGYREAMKRAGDVLANRSQRTHVPGVRIARLYAHGGENDLAIFWLQRAVDAGETPLEHLAVAWDWEALHHDPRFQALLRRMNLPQ